MFRVKICGITNVEDARLVAAAGADAVGLNFFSESPRFIDLETAQTIIESLPPSMIKVGLFVNATANQINAVAIQLALDMVQLSGDEPPEIVAELSLPAMKAFRIGESGLSSVAAWLGRCREIGKMPAACLLDAFKPGQFGGTGQTLDWSQLVTDQKSLFGSKDAPQANKPPLVLAGGLHSSNVAEAVFTVRPYAVDTASGVESSPGKKDATLVQAFVSTAKAALHDVWESSK